jgi:hypothetical protein
MKLTIEELDALIKDFVANNKDYLMNNVENMTELPEVAELFSTTGWTMCEYHAYIKRHQDPLETFVEQCMQLGLLTEEDVLLVLNRITDTDELDK